MGPDFTSALVRAHPGECECTSSRAYTDRMNDLHAPVAAQAELAPVLERLRTAWRANKPSLEQRHADLGRLRAAFARRLEAMDAAIRADFGHRSPHENLISEAMVTLAEIDLARRKLRRWAKPRRVGVGWKFWPARAEVRPSPLGVVGIISPWNYPVNLALVPLVSAIAAGNHVFLKPSEHTPRSPRPAARAPGSPGNSTG